MSTQMERTVQDVDVCSGRILCDFELFVSVGSISISSADLFDDDSVTVQLSELAVLGAQASRHTAFG